MTVPDFADAYDTSLPGPAFSNGYEGEAWMAAWCARCANSSADEDGCALTDVAMLGRVPAAWTELENGSLQNRYLCRHWEPAAGYVHLGNIDAGRPGWGAR